MRLGDHDHGSSQQRNVNVECRQTALCVFHYNEEKNQTNKKSRESAEEVCGMFFRRTLLPQNAVQRLFENCDQRKILRWSLTLCS